jgi:hypothetical protein
MYDVVFERIDSSENSTQKIVDLALVEVANCTLIRPLKMIKCNYLRKLDINFTSPALFDDFSIECSRLEELTVDYWRLFKLEKIDFERFKCPNLLSLEISKLNVEHIQNNLNFPKLNSFSLNGCSIKDFDINQIFPKSQDLSTLKIINSKITNIPSFTQNHLKELFMLNAEIQNMGAINSDSLKRIDASSGRALLDLKACNIPCLESLSLSLQCSVHNFNKLSLPRLKYLLFSGDSQYKIDATFPNLEKAILRNSPIVSFRCPMLKYLDIGESNIDYVTLKKFDCPRLDTLLISYNVIDKFDSQLNFPNLTFLSAYRNNISEFSINSSKLRYLNLYDNNLSHIDLDKYPNLTCCNLAYNKLSDSLIINNLASLDSIFIDDNKLSYLAIRNSPNLSKLSINENSLVKLNFENCFKKNYDCAFKSNKIDNRQIDSLNDHIFNGKSGSKVDWRDQTADYKLIFDSKNRVLSYSFATKKDSVTWLSNGLVFSNDSSLKLDDFDFPDSYSCRVTRNDLGTYYFIGDMKTDYKYLYKINDKHLAALKKFDSLCFAGKLSASYYWKNPYVELSDVDGDNNIQYKKKKIGFSKDTFLIRLDISSISLYGDANRVINNSFNMLSDIETLENLDLNSFKFEGDETADFNKLRNLSLIKCNQSNFNIKNYPSLKSLILRYNQINPDVAQLNGKELEYLDLSDNKFGGTLKNIDMPSLKKIVLERNDISGEFPSLASSKNLLEIRASYNKFSGSLPLFASPELKYIDLRNNSFDGKISQIKLNNLEFLDLSSNKFKAIADSIELPRCSEFLINNNNLSGEFPYIILKDTIIYFKIQNNHFSSVNKNLYLFNIVIAYLYNNNFDFDALQHFKVMMPQCLEFDNMLYQPLPQLPIKNLVYDKITNSVICSISNKDSIIWNTDPGKNLSGASIGDTLHLNEFIGLNDVKGAIIFKKDYAFDHKYYDYYKYTPDGKINIDFIDNIAIRVFIDRSELEYLNEYFAKYYKNNTSKWKAWPMPTDTVSMPYSVPELGFNLTKVGENTYRANVASIWFKSLDLTGFNYSKFPMLKYVTQDSCRLDIKDVAACTNLKYISLTNSKFSQELQNIASDSLETLIIKNCGLKGAFQAPNSKKLKYLDLSYNNIDSVDGKVFSENKLRCCLLNNNRIESKFPNINWEELDSLNLSNNDFWGNIPEIVSDSLIVLNLAKNYFYNNFLQISCSRLAFLDLSDNAFTGNLDDLNIPLVQYFKLSNNRDSLEMNNKFGSEYLNYLDLSHSGFKGTMKKIICSNKNVIINVANNNFSGDFADVYNYIYSKAYKSFDISHNNFAGTLPPIICPTSECHLSPNYRVFDFSYNKICKIEQIDPLRDLAIDISHNKIIFENVKSKIEFSFGTSDNSQDTCYSMYYSPKENALIVDSKLNENQYLWYVDREIIQDSYSNKLSIADKSRISKIKCRVRNYSLFDGLHIDAIYKGEISGVEDEVFSSEINISPNPAQDYIQLNSKLELLDNPHVSIYNQLGEKVAESNSSRIDLINLANGVYRLILEASGKRAAKSFVISR